MTNDSGVGAVNEQEKFWQDKDWAQGYISRNRVNPIQRVPFWTNILELTQARSILEVGSNIGQNLKALRCIDRQLDLKGIDVSYEACIEAVLAGLDVEQVRAADVGVKWPGKFDLSFTCGCLIHVADADLSTVMDSITQSSKRYVLAVEYESEHTEMVEYRGHANRLWRRPFGAIYESGGLKMIKQFDAGEGFDRCTASLLEKN